MTVPTRMSQLQKIQPALATTRRAETLPADLAQDISAAIDEFPNTQFLFLFHDDLPEYDAFYRIYERSLKNSNNVEANDSAEYQRIIALRKSAYKNEIEIKAKLNPLFIMDKDDLAMFAASYCSDLFSNGSGIRNSFFCSVMNPQTQLATAQRGEFGPRSTKTIAGKAPYFCVIALPALSATLRQQSAFYNEALIDEVVLSRNISPIRECLQHELGHVELICGPVAHVDWQHERFSDMRSYSRIGAQDGRTYMNLARPILTATSSIDLASAQYWNVLAQRCNDPFSPQLRNKDYAAQLEIKQRALAYLIGGEAIPVVQGKANRFVDASFNAGAYGTIRNYFSSGVMTSGRKEALLYALDRVVADNMFTYEGSRELAELTLQGAQQLLPNTFSSTYWAKYLRDKPNYLTP